jgi:hypothetical protein
MLRGWRINTTKQKPGPGEQQMTFTLYLKWVSTHTWNISISNFFLFFRCACHRCPAAVKIITIKEKDQPWTDADDASNINDGILCSAQFFTGWQEHMLHRSRSEELRYLFGPNWWWWCCPNTLMMLPKYTDDVAQIRSSPNWLVICDNLYFPNIIFIHYVLYI